MHSSENELKKKKSQVLDMIDIASFPRKAQTGHFFVYIFLRTFLQICDCDRKLRKSSSVSGKQKLEPPEENVFSLSRTIVGCWNTALKSLQLFFFFLLFAVTNARLCRNIQASQVTVIDVEMLLDQVTPELKLGWAEVLNKRCCLGCSTEGRPVWMQKLHDEPLWVSYELVDRCCWK